MVSVRELKNRVSRVYAEKITDAVGCCEDESTQVIYPVER